jgi:hypothetical protein
MAKTLKDFLEGYLKVKSADEQKFIDKHVMAKNPDRNGNGDDVFKGNTKAIDRRKERKGYDPGDDEKVYEETDLTESTYKFDVSGEHGKAGVDKLVKHANSKGIKAKVHTYDGPAGGNPVIHLTHKDPKALHSYVNTHMYPVRDISRHKINEELKGKQHKIDANKNGKLDAHDFKLLRAKKKVAEAIEELEELSTDTLNRYKTAARADASQAHQQIRTGPGRPNRRLLKRTAGGYAANRAIERQSKKTNEEAEQIDELSQDKLMQYRSAAKKQGTGIQDKMKIGGGDWSKDGKDTSTLKKRMAGYKMAGRKVNPGLSASVGKAPRVAATEETQIDEKLNMNKASMGDVVKDFKDSNAPQFKGKSPAKRRVMAIAAKLTAERGGKPLNKEERLQNRLTDISESHQRVMLEVFDKLNEDNKSKFLGACLTPNGVDQMLDFAIRHRGE